ncbi:MFS transporter [Nocardia seriolae]|uniref:Lincomycin resistance protein n=1 Tax=Nocardia seriolae TaxID=37332 RepID=A0ABC9Z4M2_9NOCA|nr:MFS transporter [Nocardia seriolae]APB01383.1 Lincomycin resistance protein [Nocardia seriolae]OJF78508.1 MFS transporter [Nocardia seriolae]QOW31247.1 MFS transporter [Nocardia seriolae]QUN18862.1 MFS transporter [Nocardia seriolae]WKY51570.1 MFS transporter [Nocardia seriolae]
MEARGVRRWLALGALAVAMLTIGLDVTVLTVALPTLAVDLHADTSALQWFSSAYTLALAAFMLPAGALGDRYGRKKFLLAALLLFGVASVACAFATSSGQLIAGRVVLGLAAAVMMPLSMAVLPTLFPEQRERQRAITIWITSTAIGLPLGPIVGGWLLQHYWWGSAFLFNVPLVIIGATATALLVPESHSGNVFRIDLLGALLSALGMLGITYGFIRCGQQGWGDALAWTSIAAGVVLGVAFVLWQRRTAHPLVDLGLFAEPGFRWGTVFMVLVNFAMFGLFFTMPQYFQAVLGVDTLGSGVRLLPLTGGLAVGSRLVDRLLPKVGVRAVLVAGFVLLTAGLGMGALITVDSGYGFAAAALVLLGVGMGFVMPAAMGAATDDLTPERAGSGSALLQALRQAGGTIGVAILGTVLSTRYRSGLGDLDRTPISDGVNAGVGVARKLGDPALLSHVQSAFIDGMSAMLWVCAAICAIAAVLAAIVIRRKDPVVTADVNTGQSVHVG